MVNRFAEFLTLGTKQSLSDSFCYQIEILLICKASVEKNDKPEMNINLITILITYSDCNHLLN